MPEVTDSDYETADEDQEFHLNFQEYIQTMTEVEGGGFVATTELQKRQIAPMATSSGC